MAAFAHPSLTAAIATARHEAKAESRIIRVAFVFILLERSRVHGDVEGLIPIRHFPPTLKEPTQPEIGPRQAAPVFRLTQTVEKGPRLYRIGCSCFVLGFVPGPDSRSTQTNKLLVLPVSKGRFRASSLAV